ncbi:MAG TPA: type II secretion system protein [Vicinamibacterales bacterium]|jgi:prepilin-type N-terminal cleavage/methylation domain-containing protein
MRSERGYTLIEMMMVVGIIGVIAATVIPITDMSIRGSRLRGDAQIIRNLVGVAKMRASAQFTRARVMANLGNPQANPPVPGSFVLQVWNKPANGNPGAWVNDGGVNQLSPGVSFGFAELNAPPPNTQVNIMQSPTCTNTLTVADPIANTACVTFNSRGLPVDANGTLYPRHALYITGDDGVWGTTITTTPLIRFWSSPHLANPLWTAR